MRKSQDFIVYPISKDDTDKIITIQSSTRIGKIDLSTGRGLMSQSHSNGAYFVHFQMDKLTPFTVSESDLEEIKAHIFRTAGSNVGTRGIVSDNSGASGVYAKGGITYYKNENERLSRPKSDMEEEVFERVKNKINPELFVGNFGWRIDNRKQANIAYGYLYALDDYDKDYVKNVKLKKGEVIFRYVTRVTAIGGMMPFIKINIEKALLYFPMFNDNDDVFFETRGTTPLWLSLIENSFANGGKTEEGVDLFEDYDNIPPKLQSILDKYEDAFQNGEYRGLEKALKEANAIGYTFEYYLDGQAYDLRKIGEKGKSEVEGYAKGGKVSNFDKLSSKVAKEYEGKPVQGKYQKEYGKVYSKEEAKEVGDKVAGKVKATTADKKAFGGLFGSAKAKLTPKTYADLDDQMVITKDGKAVHVVDQSGDTLLVIDANSLGTGVLPRKMNILEIDPTSYKAGGKVGTKKVNGGVEMLKQANVLAKKIRKDGESWLDAKKRAFAQLKK